MKKKIGSALISVYYKDGLEEVAQRLHELGVVLYSTGGTYDFLTSLGLPAISVESVTDYPSVFGGRVKTLHPKIFGGILFRRDHEVDLSEAERYGVPPIDLVIVDLYPFEETVARTRNEEEIIEKIDIGGISLIRAAAKNYRDVLIVASSKQYPGLLQLLEDDGGYTDPIDRRYFAGKAFEVTSHYDTAICNYFYDGQPDAFKMSITQKRPLRYGENPHQDGYFFGDLEQVFTQLHGKELSYNNLGDLEAAIGLIGEFEEPTFAILKHNNACGCASRSTLAGAWKAALAADPVSAYGGVLITNREVDDETADEMDRLFFEVLLAPGYKKSALEKLQGKKNRILLQQGSYGNRRLLLICGR